MRCYRIMSESHYQSPYSASGNGGRWNPKGTRMIYAGSTPTLSLLEYLCIKGSAVGSKPWHMIVFEIKDESLIAALDASTLPANWTELPHPKSTQSLGKQWLDAKEEPFLKVPSSRLSLTFYPAEFNLLINPDYQELPKLMKVIDVVGFSYLLNADEIKKA
jgi:RES domain-containing protein